MIRWKNKVYDITISEVLNKIHDQTLSNGDGFLHDIRRTSTNFMVTCPFHKQHRESNPSCTVFDDTDADGYESGNFHCFSCGESGSLIRLIQTCLRLSEDDAASWLEVNALNTCIVDSSIYLPEMDVYPPSIKKEPKTIDSNILNKYQYYHEYMWKRNLSKEVIDLFNVGYDPNTRTVVFPVWDMKNNLVAITKRSVDSKYFFIDSGIEKPVYLLNYVIAKGFNSVIVTEGQIDALTAWTYGFPCVATIGNVSEYQMQCFNKSGINTFITMFDNDVYGSNFTNFFKRNIRKDVLVYTASLPRSKKDINELSKEEFYKCLGDIGIHTKLNTTFDKLVLNDKL